MADFKIFQLIRSVDSTGVSGTGIVADGCVFSNGKVCLCWRGALSSIVIHDNIDNIMKIHCHNGDTYVKYSAVNML